jgi:hypothetical protein
LQAVTCRKVPLRLAVPAHVVQTVRVVGGLLAVLPLNREKILLPVNAGDMDVFARSDAHPPGSKPN